MNHQNILKHLSARYTVQCLDEEIRRAIWSHTNLTKLFKLRWNCLLENDEVSKNTKNITLVAIAVLLHKYDCLHAMDDIISKAKIAIDELNKEVVLSDAFERQSEDIKRFLSTEPTPLKRKPAFVDAITFYRAKDVVAFEIAGRFYGAYVFDITGVNEAPVMEFYDGEFESLPTLEQLIDLPAKGCSGQTRRLGVYGMKYMPDIANQITLIASGVEKRPSSEHLENSVGLYMMSDIFEVMTDSRVNPELSRA